MPKITAFVARSFSQGDGPKVEPILAFLDSFRRLGFVWETAEPAEVESVSQKVRGMIDASDVFIGIFTRRHAIYQPPQGLRAAFDVLTSKFPVTTWAAPPWVLQESGYALRAGKSLILFRESGVEIPGLQGDLEYIPFEPLSPGEAFKKATAMINGLIADRAGITVETVVTAAVETQEASVAAAAPQAEAAPRQDILQYLQETVDHLAQRSWQAAEQAFQRGLALAHENGRRVDLQAWYHKERFEAGDPNALEELKSLASANPEDPTPLTRLAECVSEYSQHQEAAQYYMAASAIAEREDGLRYRVRAADCLRLAKKFDEAREILMKSWTDAWAKNAELRFGILRGLYDVLKESGKSFEAFSIAEMALHENPARTDLRFSTGLDYDRSGHLEMFLHHYKIICDREPENAAALHNLALAYSELEFPIGSVFRYKQAFKLGETLSASNLGYVYLEVGMLDEAVSLLREAQQREGCVPDVTRCLAAVEDRRKQEDKTVLSKLETAKGEQSFLVSFGDAFLCENPPSVVGTWAFPFGTITLDLRDGTLSGEAVIEVPNVRSAVFGTTLRGPGEGAVQEFERIVFLGQVHGRTCKYGVTRRMGPGSGKLGNAAVARILGGGTSTSTSEGYIVFAPNGQSGSAAQLKKGRPEEYYQIQKEH